MFDQRLNGLGPIEVERPHRPWPPPALLVLLTVVTFAAGWAQKLPCRNGYGAGNTVAYSRLCYSDVRVAWHSEKLAEGRRPYVDHPVEYPVLIGGLMALAAWGADNGEQFFDRTAILLLLGALTVVLTTRLLAGPAQRPRDAALVALAPGLVLHGTVSWDLAAAMWAGLGLLAWSRHKPLLAGMALGLGAATKLYPALFLLPLLLLCWRARTLRSWVRATTGAAAAWAACYLVGYALAGSFVFDGRAHRQNAVLRFFLYNRDRPADWDSLWFGLQHLVRPIRHDPAWMFAPGIVNLMSGTAFLLALGGLGVLFWRAPMLPRVPQAVFLVVVAFLLTNKVFSPQYTIWLVPLAVLARPRWSDFFAWQLTEVLVTITRFAFFLRLADPSAGLPLGAFLGSVIVRDLALLALAYSVAGEILHPERDAIRAAHHGTDPAGGPLAPRERLA